MAFPKQRIPRRGRYNIAPEPPTAAMDRIDFSRMWGMGSCLLPGEPDECRLIISVEEGEQPLG